MMWYLFKAGCFAIFPKNVRRRRLESLALATLAVYFSSNVSRLTDANGEGAVVFFRCVPPTRYR